MVFTRLGVLSSLIFQGSPLQAQIVDIPGDPEILPSPRVFTINEVKDVPTEVKETPAQTTQETKPETTEKNKELPKEPPPPEVKTPPKPVAILPKHIVEIVLRNTEKDKLKLYVLPVSNRRKDKTSLDTKLYRQKIVEELKKRKASVYEDLEGPKVLKKLQLPPKKGDVASGVLSVQVFEDKVILTILREKGLPPKYFTFRGEAFTERPEEPKENATAEAPAEKPKEEVAEQKPNEVQPLTQVPAPPPSGNSQQVQWYAIGAGGLLGISLISASLTYLAMEDLDWLEGAESDTANKNEFYTAECDKVKATDPGHPICLSRNDFFKINQQIREKIDEKDTEVLVLGITA